VKFNTLLSLLQPPQLLSRNVMAILRKITVNDQLVFSWLLCIL